MHKKSKNINNNTTKKLKNRLPLQMKCCVYKQKNLHYCLMKVLVARGRFELPTSGL